MNYKKEGLYFMVDFKKEILDTIKKGEDTSEEYDKLFEENQKLIDEWDRIFKDEENFKFKP